MRSYRHQAPPHTLFPVLTQRAEHDAFCLPPDPTPTPPFPGLLSHHREHLQRDVAVPARAAPPLLAQRDSQRPDELPPRAPGFDDIVDVSPLRGNEGIGEEFGVLVDELPTPANGVVGRLQLAVKDDVDRALRTHHRDLRGRPADVEVRADVL